MNKTIRFLFSTDINLIPNTRAIEGTGVVMLRETIMIMGQDFFQYVIEYDPTTISPRGKEVIESWRGHAHTVEDPMA